MDSFERQFENTMKIFPLLWFALCFQNGCGIIWALKNFDKLGMTRYRYNFEMMTYFGILISISSYIFVFDYVSDKYDEGRFVLVKKLIDKNVSGRNLEKSI